MRAGPESECRAGSRARGPVKPGLVRKPSIGGPDGPMRRGMKALCVIKEGLRTCKEKKKKKKEKSV